MPQQVVQACHACIEIARSLDADAEHPHLVVIGCESEVHLQFVAARLDAIGIQYRPFYEPDLAESLTALATEPLSDARKKPLRRYRCWSVPPPTVLQSHTGQPASRATLRSETQTPDNKIHTEDQS